MANSSLALGSSLNLRKINKSVNSLGESVRRAQSSSASISKSLLDSNRNKRKSLSLSSTLFRRRREATLRREREDIIEAGSVVGAVRRTGKVVMSSTKGFLGRILDYLGSVLVGWAILNLPKIISMAQDLIGRMQKYFSILQDFVSGMFTNITGFIDKIGETINNINVFQFGTVKEIFDKAVEKMRDSFVRIENGVTKIINRISKISSIKDLVDYLNKFEGFTFDINDFNIPGLPKIFDRDAPPSDPNQQEPKNNGKQYSGQWAPILRLVRGAEGGYDSVNYGSGPGRIPGLSNMTIRGAYEATERYRKKYGGTGAMGAYQIVDSPLARAKAAGLDVDKDLFSPKNQDLIGIYMIQVERKITPELIKNNPVEAAKKLAQLFAGIPVLSSTYSSYAKRTVRRGESFYQGFGGNKATTTAENVEKAFKEFASYKPPASAKPFSLNNKVNSTGMAGDPQTIQYPDGQKQTFKPGTLINQLPTKPFSADIAMAPETGRDVLIINRTTTQIQQAARPLQQQQGGFDPQIAMVNNTWDKMQFTALT